MMLFASDVDWLPRLGSPNPGANEFLGWYYLRCGWRGSQYPFERDLPAPLTLYPLLFSGMVCLYFSGGSWMAALIVMLMALSPPLAWARKIQRKFIPWMVTYHGVGGWGGTELTLSLHPGQTPYKLWYILIDHLSLSYGSLVLSIVKEPGCFPT